MNLEKFTLNIIFHFIFAKLVISMVPGIFFSVKKAGFIMYQSEFQIKF